MSGSFPASGTTSHVSSVRSSEALAGSNHVSGTASPSKPKAITSTSFSKPNEITRKNVAVDGNPGDDTRLSGPVNGYDEIRNNAESDLNTVNGHVDVGDHVGSDPNTPRAPPSRNGRNDLDGIPREAATQLDTNDKSSCVPLTPDEAAANHHVPSSPTVSANTFSSSISEPGSKGGGKPLISVQRRSYLLQGQDQAKVTSWLQGAEQIDTVPFIKSKTLSYTPRTASSQFPVHTRMSENEKEATDAATNAANPARDVGFSEQRNRSSSRSSQSRVEKRIEATLADAEPSSHARSRKSSHTLGLFKETTASQGTSKGQSRTTTLSDNEIDPRPNADDLPEKNSSKYVKAGHSPPREKSGSKEFTDRLPLAFERQDDAKSEEERTRQRTPQASRLGPSTESHKIATAEASDKTDVPVSVSDDKSALSSNRPSNAAKSTIPPRLLEEIRNFHNLAEPIHDKFRSTQHKPVSPSMDKDTLGIRQRTPASPPGERNDLDVSIKPKTDGDDNEDEESEHISSILYNPHQAPSPDALEDVSIDNARKLKEASVKQESHLPEPALSPLDRESNAEDVDIALHVHNKNRYFHGDLSKAQPSPMEAEIRQIYESGFSSASESEYESQDEHRTAGTREDSSLTDDGEITPRASPNTKKSYLASRSRKGRRGPTTPLGAVELKPFNHQVGGHTNLFRFSKRAVCKQLSNRENEFYEVVERQHPELLKFLPKYVLLRFRFCLR